jgi:hypothetical protein
VSDEKNSMEADCQLLQTKNNAPSQMAVISRLQQGFDALPGMFYSCSNYHTAAA